MSDKIQVRRFKKYNADQFGVCFMVSTQVQGNKANMRTTFIHSRHRLLQLDSIDENLLIIFYHSIILQVQRTLPAQRPVVKDSYPSSHSAIH